MKRNATASSRRERGEHGQVLILAVVALILVIIAVLLLFDVQTVIRGKVKAQNGVDAAALTGAEWQKHSLNLIGGCSLCSHGKKHYVNASAQGFDQTMRFNFEFVNYPLEIPLHDWLTGRDSITISSESELTNHASAFLE